MKIKYLFIIFAFMILFLLLYSITNKIEFNNASILYISDVGAKCDGISDDWEAINSAISYAKDHEISEINMGTGLCNVSKPLKIYCNTKTKDENVKGKIKISGTATFIHKDIDFIEIENGCDDVTIDGITSISLYTPYHRDINNDNKIDENDSIRHIRNSFDNHSLKLQINNVNLIGGVTGIFGNDLKSLRILNSNFTDMHFIPEYGRGGYGILTQGCKNVFISNCNFIAGKYYRHGIYLSVNQPLYNENENIVITQCKFNYSAIEPVNFSDLYYPKDKIYEGIKNSHIFSPSTAPIVVRKSNNLKISDSLFIDTPNAVVFTGENGNIDNIYLKNLTIYPKNRIGEYNYGVYFSGRIKNNKQNRTSGIVDNLNVISTDKEYKYAAVSHSNVTFKNTATTLDIYNITPTTNKITGLNRTMYANKILNIYSFKIK